MPGEILLITGGPLTEIEIGATGIREIIQNVKTILATVKGSLFLDRDFGVDGSIVDEPMSRVRQRLIGEIAAEVEKEEPRVKVLNIELLNPGVTAAADGLVIPRVTVQIRDGVLL